MPEMTLNEYAAWVEKAWSSSEYGTYDLLDDYIMGLGLSGEVGEVQEILKKHVRDNKPLNYRNLTLEIGDVLYYLMMLCVRHGIDPADVMKQNIKKVEGRAKKRKAAKKKAPK